jgi:hypothetical protein
MKVIELRFIPVPVQLDDNCVAAIVAYTHDLQQVDKQGNVYFELNVMLRKRTVPERTALLETWGGFSEFRHPCWCQCMHCPCFSCAACLCSTRLS